MKKLITFLMLSVFTLQLSAQSSTLFMKVNNELTLFNRPLPANTIILNLADDKLYRLTSVGSVNASLSTSSVVDLTNAATGYTETDPFWAADKPNYATTEWSINQFTTTSWVQSQNYLKSFTELDPLWTDDKPNYSLKADVHDTAQVIRSEFENFLQEDDIWTQSSGQIQSKSSSINIDQRQYNYTSATADVIFIDSIYIPINSIVNIESNMLSVSSNFITSSWRIKISYKRIANSISPLPNAFTILNREERIREFNFDYNTSNGYIRFKIKGEDSLNVKWKLNINYKQLTI